MIYPHPVVEMMADIVANLPDTLLEQIQAAQLAIRQQVVPDETESDIKSIRFEYGHPTELMQTMKERTLSPTGKFDMWPVVMLFTDIVTAPSGVRGQYGTVSLNMVIAYCTSPTMKAAERMEKNFKPILRPIYEALIYAIARSGYFWVQSPKQLLGRDTDRLFWGKTGLYGNEGNQFNDYIDAIEIKDLSLTPNYKNKVNS